METIRSVLSLRSVQDDLVYLYRQSQSECSKNGRLSMEIGTSREKDLIAVLRHHIGSGVEYDVGTHAPEDVKICGEKFSIKHLSSRVGIGNIKIKWTSDTERAHDFREQLFSSLADEYYSNMILVYIDRSTKTITIIGVLRQVIMNGVEQLGYDAFISRTGTNNRGVELMKYILAYASFRIILYDVDLVCCDPIQRRIRILANYKKMKENRITEI